MPTSNSRTVATNPSTPPSITGTSASSRDSTTLLQSKQQTSKWSKFLEERKSSGSSDTLQVTTAFGSLKELYDATRAEETAHKWKSFAQSGGVEVPDWIGDSEIEHEEKKQDTLTAREKLGKDVAQLDHAAIRTIVTMANKQLGWTKEEAQRLIDSVTPTSQQSQSSTGKKGWFK